MRLEKMIDSHPFQNNEFTKRITALKDRTEDQVPYNKEEVNAKAIETTVSEINEMMDPLRTNIKFQFHEKLNDYYVTVINASTDEVIREIPPKKMLDMYAAMAEFMGILVDEKI